MKAMVAFGLLLGAACDEPPYIPPLADADTSTTCNIQPTLSSLTATYFKGSCVFSGCHNTRSAKGDLDLSTGVYAALVNVVAVDEGAGPRGKLRVKPGDPDASFMVQKVEGTMAADEGEIMPEGTPEVVDPNCSVKMLRQWIQDGALDN